MRVLNAKTQTPFLVRDLIHDNRSIYNLVASNAEDRKDSKIETLLPLGLLVRIDMVVIVETAVVVDGVGKTVTVCEAVVVSVVVTVSTAPHVRFASCDLTSSIF